MKEEGGLKERAAEAREDVIKRINHDTGGDDQYDHLYRENIFVMLGHGRVNINHHGYNQGVQYSLLRPDFMLFL